MAQNQKYILLKELVNNMQKIYNKLKNILKVYKKINKYKTVLLYGM